MANGRRCGGEPARPASNGLSKRVRQPQEHLSRHRPPHTETSPPRKLNYVVTTTNYQCRKWSTAGLRLSLRMWDTKSQVTGYRWRTPYIKQAPSNRPISPARPARPSDQAPDKVSRHRRDKRAPGANLQRPSVTTFPHHQPRARRFLADKRGFALTTRGGQSRPGKTERKRSRLYPCSPPLHPFRPLAVNDGN